MQMQFSTHSIPYWITWLIGIVMIGFGIPCLVHAYEIKQAARIVSSRHIDQPKLADIPTDSKVAFERFLKEFDHWTEVVDDKTYEAIGSGQGKKTKGIGAALLITADELLLVPYVDKPAYREGLKDPGYIRLIDGQSVSKMIPNRW